MNIDAMSREELLQQVDALELTVSSKANTETIRKAVKAALGEEETAPVEVIKKDEIEIMFAEDRDNKQPVYVGVNCKSYRFPRGMWVKAPRFLLPTIQNMGKRIMDPATGEFRTIQPYPYQVREL